MSIVPILRAREVIALLQRIGFRIISQKGSHVKLQHFINKTRQVIIPFHNKDLKRGTLLSILRQAKISLQDFLNLLRK